MPKTPYEIEQPPAPDRAIFASLEAFRRHCGQPSMPLEQCARCTAIPDHCYRQSANSIVSDYDVDYGDERFKTTVPEQVSELEFVVNGPRLGHYDGAALLRCPTCHRLYFGKSETEIQTVRTYFTTTYQRTDADSIFRSRWCVEWRLPDRDIAAAHPRSFLADHALVRFPEADTWFLLDDHNQLTELGELSEQALQRALTSARPDDPIDYVRFLAGLEGAVVIESFEAIRWRDPVAGDREQIEAARSASRVEPPSVELAGDQAVVRLWVVSKQRLILRVVTVRETGAFLREDAVIAEDLPVVIER